MAADGKKLIEGYWIRIVVPADADSLHVEPFRTAHILDDQLVSQNSQAFRTRGEFSGSLPKLSDSLEKESIPKIVDNDIPPVDEINSLLLNDNLAGAFEFREGDDALGLAGIRQAGREDAENPYEDSRTAN